MFFLFLISLLGFFPQAFAHIVELNWDVTWVTASPDGFQRPVVGINGQFPLPAINVNVGDRLIVHLTNQLGNETTSLHWHGLYQSGTSAMDGPVGVNQCPIPPGQTFTYDFVINQSGTYWYHSHSGGQYVDGLRGPIIVHDPKAPFKYDVDMTITMSDWYHDQGPSLIHTYMSPDNIISNDGAEPIPYSMVLNDEQNIKLSVMPSKTYMLRIINIGSFVGGYIKIDGHEMTIVEIDGVYVEPYQVDMIYVTVAQRYAVLISTKSDTQSNFAISATLDTMMFDHIPAYNNPDVFGWLVYDSTKPLPTPTPLRTYTQLDDTQLVPVDHERLLKHVDNQIMMTMAFDVEDGIGRATINNITWIPQTVPTLYTVLSAPAKYVMNPAIYGVNSNAQVLKYNDVIEIVLINNDNGHHPWHLHGHAFQVIARSPSNTAYDPNLVSQNAPAIPMRRDTIQVHEGGYVVLRYRADNPGIYLFHCHIEWHIEAGLTATILEAPDKVRLLQSTVPHDHLEVCHAQGIKTKGNAAGNEDNWLDLTGAPTQINLNDWGALIDPPPAQSRMARRRRVRR